MKLWPKPGQILNNRNKTDQSVFYNISIKGKTKQCF